jgi:predicted 2-oxoglutarate/Fe(II)-dependent dioxygenase YbiX
MREVAGKTVLVTDDRHKRRRDFLIEDAQLRRELVARLLRRLKPAVEKAFQFRATRIERYLVACYEAPHGHFRPHRDNTTRGTAHRRFAVTINLNAGEYEGGDLRFPEYGARTYRAPTGGAVVFSCSLLHEATPMISGRRFAFLPFLYDEEGARIREENNPHLGPGVGEYRMQGEGA